VNSREATPKRRRQAKQIEAAKLSASGRWPELLAALRGAGRTRQRAQQRPKGLQWPAPPSPAREG
jgi:hypothetical protein